MAHIHAPWPQAMAGVVGHAGHPTTPRWLLPARPSLPKEGTPLGAPFTYVVLYRL